MEVSVTSPTESRTVCWTHTGSLSLLRSEPYCAGPIGLNRNWTAGVAKAVAMVAPLPHIKGIFLGDEPEINGVPWSELCELTLHLKQALQNASRRDIFLSDDPLPPASFQTNTLPPYAESANLLQPT